MTEILSLLWGTVVHRPYVYAFFVCFLGFSFFQQGPRKTGLYLVLAYLIALASELASTRYGFPFGMYVYLDETRTRELWISNVPFWDSLSFVFLSYFSWMLAGAIRTREATLDSFDRSLRSLRSCLLAGILMMLLDVVIDPLTLLGDRWFLGKIYYYPDGGTYFGVTLANFAGWCFIGGVTPWVFQRVLGTRITRSLSPLFFRGVLGVYAGVFLFNLCITAWIGEWPLFAASLGVSAITLSFSGAKLRKLDHA